MVGEPPILFYYCNIFKYLVIFFTTFKQLEFTLNLSIIIFDNAIEVRIPEEFMDQ